MLRKSFFMEVKAFKRLLQFRVEMMICLSSVPPQEKNTAIVNRPTIEVTHILHQRDQIRIPDPKETDISTLAKYYDSGDKQKIGIICLSHCMIWIARGLGMY